MMKEMQPNHRDKDNHSLIFFLKKSSGNMIFISFAAFSLCQQTMKFTGKHGKIDPVGTDEIDPVKTA